MNSQQDECWIEYAPRFNTTTGDVTCFVAPPTVTAEKDPISSRWTLTASFRMRWDAMNDMNDEQYTPSIVVLDENQDVGLGASYLADLSWTTHTRLSLVVDDVSDRVAPFGVYENNTLTTHLDDFADIDVIVVHEDTLQPALHIPFDSRITWAVFHNADTSFSTESTIDTTEKTVEIAGQVSEIVSQSISAGTKAFHDKRENIKTTDIVEESLTESREESVITDLESERQEEGNLEVLEPFAEKTTG